jgi:hypothetical protein
VDVAPEVVEHAFESCGRPKTPDAAVQGRGVRLADTRVALRLTLQCCS